MSLSLCVRVAVCLFLAWLGAACTFAAPASTGTPTTTLTSSPSATVTATSSPTPSSTATPPPLLTSTLTARPTFTPSPSPTQPPPTPAFPKTITFDAWSPVLSLAWSPDGETLAVGAGLQVYLYKAVTLTETLSLSPGAFTTGLAFRPTQPNDARQVLVLAGQNGSVQWWDAFTGERICTFDAHPKPASSVAFSPDGSSLVSTGSNPLVRLWDIGWALQNDTCKISAFANLVGSAKTVPAAAFSPDGALLASVDGTSILLRETGKRKLVRTLRGEATILRIAFSPDGRWLAASEIHRAVRLWDVVSGQAVGIWRAPTAPGDPFSWSVAFSPDGSFLAVGDSAGEVLLWKVDTGEIVARFDAHSKAVPSLAFSPDGHLLATGGLDAAVRLWQIP